MLSRRLIRDRFRSDWTLDVTHTRVDVQDGWQYARLLDDSEDKWAAEQPPLLERLLSGSGLVQGMTASSSSGGSGMASGSTSGAGGLRSPRAAKGKGPANTNLSFARRRRWVSCFLSSMLLKSDREVKH